MATMFFMTFPILIYLPAKHFHEVAKGRTIRDTWNDVKIRCCELMPVIGPLW